MLAVGVTAGVVEAPPERARLCIDRGGRPELVSLPLLGADRAARERSQRAVEHEHRDVVRQIRTVDAVRDEDTVTTERDGGIRAKAADRLLRQDELPEDEAGGGLVPG